MPIYEYVCKKCGNEFEVLVFNKDDKQECPACGAKKPTKKMSSFGFSAGHKFKSSSTANGSSCASCGSSDCSSCS
jgi:putative FmdB family regulatory protein